MVHSGDGMGRSGDQYTWPPGWEYVDIWYELTYDIIDRFFRVRHYRCPYDTSGDSEYGSWENNRSSRSPSLWQKGSRTILSIILAIACLGWFGIQANVCGAALANLLAEYG